jgi:hypothetical protein
MSCSPRAWKQNVLYTFQGQSDGANPAAALILDHRGNLYGTTSGLDLDFNYHSTVFELSPASAGTWTGDHNSCLLGRWIRHGDCPFRRTQLRPSRQPLRHNLLRREPHLGRCRRRSTESRRWRSRFQTLTFAERNLERDVAPLLRRQPRWIRPRVGNLAAQEKGRAVRNNLVWRLREFRYGVQSRSLTQAQEDGV